MKMIIIFEEKEFFGEIPWESLGDSVRAADNIMECLKKYHQFFTT